MAWDFVVPGFRSLPMTPLNKTFVALPRIHGPLTVNPTETTPNSTARDKSESLGTQAG